jgi:hypothetical protein
VVRDEHVIPIDPSTPVGDVPLLVGMYSLGSGERLSIQDANGVSIGDAVRLTTVRVDRTRVRR